LTLTVTAAVRERVALRGHLSLTVVRDRELAPGDLQRYADLTVRQGLSPADALEEILGTPDPVREHREGDNVMCTTGWTALAAAMVWAGLQDQASNLGLTSATFLTPLYGAVGNGSGTPAKSDSQLFAELSRQTVGAGASSPATSSIAAETTWLFYFASPATTWTVTEAGLFALASSATNSGSMVDHWAFSPTVTVPTTDSLITEISLAWGP
jgi:hypothetical protein